MSDFDDTRGKMGDTSGKMGDTSGKMGDTSGKMGDTSGRTLDDIKREIARGRLEERIACLENKVARLEREFIFVTEHLDDRLRAIGESLETKASAADLQTLERRVVAEIKRQITAALAPIEERLRKLEKPQG